MLHGTGRPISDTTRRKYCRRIGDTLIGGKGRGVPAAKKMTQSICRTREQGCTSSYWPAQSRYSSRWAASRSSPRYTRTLSPHSSFLILLGATHIAEAARKALAKLAINHQYSPAAAYVTVSSGISVLTNIVVLTEQHLIRAADQALCRAKRLGRNNTVSEHAELEADAFDVQ